jgi:hypothetical protein
MQITMPQMPETLTYAVLASIGIDVILAILLGVRGDGLGALLVLAVAAASYWFLCRHLVTIVPASIAAAVGTIVLLLGTVADLAAGHPYYCILFIVATIALAVVFVLLHQGTKPAELRVGGIVAVDVSASGTHLAMLAQLRDAGILTPEEYAAKSALLGA